MAEDGSTDWVPMEDTQFGNGDTQATGGAREAGHDLQGTLHPDSEEALNGRPHL